MCRAPRGLLRSALAGFWSGSAPCRAQPQQPDARDLCLPPALGLAGDTRPRRGPSLRLSSHNHCVEGRFPSDTRAAAVAAEAGMLPWPDQRKTDTLGRRGPCSTHYSGTPGPSCCPASVPRVPRVQAQLTPSVHSGTGAGCPQAWLAQPSPTASSAGAAGWRPGPWRPSWPR